MDARRWVLTVACFGSGACASDDNGSSGDTTGTTAADDGVGSSSAASADDDGGPGPDDSADGTSSGIDGGSTAADSGSGSDAETGTDAATGTSSDSGSDTGSDSGTESGSDTGTMACDGEDVLLFAQAPAVSEVGAPAGTAADGSIRSADDFTVAGADQCWCITRVVLSGVFFDANLAGDLEVGFYADADGLPQNPSLAVELGVPTDTAGTLDYTLSTPVVLGADDYWLGATVEIPSVEAGIWFWLPSDTTNGNPWAIEADFAQFPAGCDAWTAGNGCFPFEQQDLAFEIWGVVGGDAC